VNLSIPVMFLGGKSCYKQPVDTKIIEKEPTSFSVMLSSVAGESGGIVCTHFRWCPLFSTDQFP
jgi:hypothetical protein